jgi:hypothetical protein
MTNNGSASDRGVSAYVPPGTLVGDCRVEAFIDRGFAATLDHPNIVPIRCHGRAEADRLEAWGSLRTGYVASREDHVGCS